MTIHANPSRDLAAFVEGAKHSELPRLAEGAVTPSVRYNDHDYSIGNGELSRRLLSDAKSDNQWMGWSDEKITHKHETFSQRFADSQLGKDIAAARGLNYGELTSTNRDKLNQVLFEGASVSTRKSRNAESSASFEGKSPQLSSGGMRQEVLESRESVTSIREQEVKTLRSESATPMLSLGETREQTLSSSARMRNAFSQFFSLVGSAISSIGSIFRSRQALLEKGLLSALNAPPTDDENVSAATSGPMSLISKQAVKDVVRGDYLINGVKYSHDDLRGCSDDELEEKKQTKINSIVGNLFRACGGNENQLKVLSLMATQRSPACMLDTLREVNFEPAGVYDKKLLDKARESNKTLADWFSGGVTNTRYDIRTQNDGSVLLEVSYRKENVEFLSIPPADVVELDPDNTWIDLKCAMRIGTESPTPSVSLTPLSGSSGVAMNVDMRVTQQDF